MVLQVDPSTGRVIDAPVPNGQTATVLALVDGVTRQVLIQTGSGGVPAGAAVMTDSLLASLKASMTETASQADVLSGFVRGAVTESNATPTEDWKFGLPGALAEANQTPSAAFSPTAIFTASGSFVIPAGVTSITGVCRGGGKGGAAGTNTGGTGGAGGDYSRATVTVTPGETLTLTIAAASAAGANGADTVLLRGSTVLVRARGGGSASTNVGTTTFTGGPGAAGTLLGAGGVGGGGAGDAANATGQAGGTAGGGNGGAASVAGTAPGGGGGGGAGSLTSPGAATAGARGEARIAWTTAG